MRDQNECCYCLSRLPVQPLLRPPDAQRATAPPTPTPHSDLPHQHARPFDLVGAEAGPTHGGGVHPSVCACLGFSPHQCRPQNTHEESAQSETRADVDERFRILHAERRAGSGGGGEGREEHRRNLDRIGCHIAQRDTLLESSVQRWESLVREQK